MARAAALLSCGGRVVRPPAPRPRLGSAHPPRPPPPWTGVRECACSFRAAKGQAARGRGRPRQKSHGFLVVAGSEFLCVGVCVIYRGVSLVFVMRRRQPASLVYNSKV